MNVDDTIDEEEAGRGKPFVSCVDSITTTALLLQGL